MAFTHLTDSQKNEACMSFHLIDIHVAVYCLLTLHHAELHYVTANVNRTFPAVALHEVFN